MAQARRATRRRPLAPRVGVVLAAGRSGRLRRITGGGSKSLVHLGGLRLVERAVRSLLRAGLEEVVVVLGYNAGPVGAVVSRMGPRVRTAMAGEWRQGNAHSLAAAEDLLAGEDSFILVTADHLFGEGALERLLDAGEAAVLVDHSPTPEALKEGTKVRVDEAGLVRKLGKRLRQPAIDCGAFLLPVEVFGAQRAAAADGDGTLAGAVSRLAAERPIRAVPIEGTWWQDVDTPEDLSLARDLLRWSLIKDTDGPVARYFNRPLSTWLSMRLAALRPSPDLASYVAFAVAIGGAWLLGTEEELGGAVVYLASILDGVDGELARLQLRETARGALLDGLLDRIADAAVLGALGIWALVAGGLAAQTVVGLTAAAVAASMLSMATKDRTQVLGLPPAPERALGYLLGGRDGRLLLVAVGAIFGEPAGALMAVALTSGLSVLLRVWFVRRVARIVESRSRERG